MTPECLTTTAKSVPAKHRVSACIWPFVLRISSFVIVRWSAALESGAVQLWRRGHNRRESIAEGSHVPGCHKCQGIKGREQAVDDEPRHLERVVKLCGGYLLVAGTVPMLAVMLLVFSGMGSKFALGILSTVSFGGFGLVYLAYRLLQRDLEPLTSAVKPIEADEV